MEGTVLKWLKKEGDKINEDESVLEVATDKVDTEIPSTCSGTLKKILAEEGEVVKVGSPIAIIDSDEENTSDDGLDFIDEIEKNFEKVKEITYQKPDASTKKIKSESNRFYSPLVLNIATRENISLDTLDEINGTGENDRVTKYDLLKFIEDKNFVMTDVSLTKEFNYLSSGFNNILGDLSMIKESVLKSNDDFQLVHMIINKFIVDKKDYLEFYQNNKV